MKYGIAVHSLDTSPGQSGSSLQRKKEDGTYEIFAIHMGHAFIDTENLAEDNYYTGALITTEVY